MAGHWVTHSCGHERGINIRPNTAPADVERIIRTEAAGPCPDCLAVTNAAKAAAWDALYGPVVTAMDAVDAAKAALDQAKTVRDEAIRTALATGATYAELGKVTGLSRPGLDLIRRAGIVQTATLTTEHGTYTGRTVATIVRREYGRNASIEWSGDQHAVYPGQITRPSRQWGTREVLATVRHHDGPTG